MSLLIETYLNFESRDSLIDHLTSSYAEARLQDEVPLFLSAAYTRWARAFPQDCLDGFQPEKYHGKRAPHPVYPVNGSPATCGFPEVVRATLKSVCRTSHRIVDSMFEFVHEGALLNQEQRLINYIEQSLERSVHIAGPFLKPIEQSTWQEEFKYAVHSWMVYNRLPLSMLSNADAITHVVPRYLCYLPDMPRRALLIKWRQPTPVLDHIDGQEDEIFDKLMSDWEEELHSVHSDYLGSDGVLSDHNGEDEDSEDSDSGSESVAIEEIEWEEHEFSDDDEYMPGPDSSEESDSDIDSDDNEEPWVKLL